MTPRERFRRVLNFEPVDMLPRIEWAAWWEITVDRWKKEGLDPSFDKKQILDYFHMDDLVCVWITPAVPAEKAFGEGVMRSEEDYREIKKTAYSDEIIEKFIANLKKMMPEYENGDYPMRVWLDGFFWYPRKLFGIEPHMYAFYDYPDLMREINSDLADFNKRAIEAVYTVTTPEIMAFAEDMSYNHGPMLSYELFCEFIKPYYLIDGEAVRKGGSKLMIDSDGDITSMIPWMIEAGIQGVYPLERQAGVDINKIREMYPDFLMMGGYNKMIMSGGEEAIRAEFERIMPVVKSGGYIISVDHQTPPDVSFENYATYARLYNEYARRCGTVKE